MNLSSAEQSCVFSIMRDLSSNFCYDEVRRRIAQNLLKLLDADYFASYLWDSNTQKFVSCVQLNMSDDNLKNYEDYFQYKDPITPVLQNRRTATPVSHVMEHSRLAKTEFFNDFLKKDGLCYGINYYAYDKGENIGDIRIWRNASKTDFGSRETQILDVIGPCFTNALSRAIRRSVGGNFMGFSQLLDKLEITRREAQVADLVVSGRSDEEICAKLRIAKPTLRTHITSIFSKTGMVRRTQFAPYLLKHQ